MSKPQADPSFVLNFFTEELQSDNVHHRLFAANNVALIAAAMGPEHARTELLQYLQNAHQFDGEVQMSLASCFGNLVKYVGGANYAHLLLNPLKVLAGAEELIVRDKAVDSMKAVCDMIPAASADTHLMAAAKDLATAEFFTSRSSASTFISKIVSKVSDNNKTNLRNLYVALVKDETPMVRRSSLKNLPAFAEQIYSLTSDIVKDLIGPAINDDEDSVRLLLPAALSVISGKLSESDRQALILNYAKTLCKDHSWRVRSSLANELSRICTPFSIQTVRDEFCPLLFKLLKDPEAETKAAACKTMSNFFSLLKKDGDFVSEKFLPEVEQLVNDGAPQVRREVALHLMELQPIIGKEKTLKSVIPLFLTILRNPENESSVALLDSLEKADVPSIQASILPAILEIVGDAHWRVKVAIIKLLPTFAKEIQVADFQHRFYNLIVGWLNDFMFSVRETMANQLPKLAKIYGNDWASTTLAPTVLEFKQNKSYLLRQMTLLCINQLATALPIQQLIKLFLPAVVQMASDKVANVRFYVAKTLQLFVKSGDQKADQQVGQTLKTLSNDADTDVKYFACTALLKCQ